MGYTDGVKSGMYTKEWKVGYTRKRTHTKWAIYTKWDTHTEWKLGYT